jgi:hypothetical protein
MNVSSRVEEVENVVVEMVRRGGKCVVGGSEGYAIKNPILFACAEPLF